MSLCFTWPALGSDMQNSVWAVWGISASVILLGPVQLSGTMRSPAVLAEENRD